MNDPNKTKILFDVTQKSGKTLTQKNTVPC